VAGLGTTINGGNNVFVTPRPVSHISANLNGGDDALGLTNNAQAIFNLATTSFGVNLQAILGLTPAAIQTVIAANTTVTEFSLPGSLTVAAGSGDDVIGVIGSIGGPVVVSLGTADVGSSNAFGIDGSSLAAGNGVVGAGISIVGDNQADQVAIVSTDVRHSISAALGGGLNSFTLVDANVGGGVSVAGGGGNDAVAVGDSAIAAGVSVVMGAATNSLSMTRTSTSVIAVTGGSGADTVFAERVTVSHGVTVWTGGADDRVTIQGDQGGRSTIGGSLTIDTGAGSDIVALTLTNIAHSLAVVLGDGVDSFASDRVNIAWNATIDAGSGADTLTMRDTVVGYFLYAFLGDGDDNVTIATSDARAAYLFGGHGTMDRLTVDAASRAAIDTFFSKEFEL
jgi:hypothetical protein